MPLKINDTTNAHNMRTQRRSLEAKLAAKRAWAPDEPADAPRFRALLDGIAKLDAALARCVDSEELRQRIEKTTAKHNAERAAQGLPPKGVVRYPPWCITPASKAAYRKNQAHDQKLAANKLARAAKGVPSRTRTRA